MNMKDITIIFLTENRLPEKWAAYQRKVLLEAIGAVPLISFSRKPMDLGINILQTEPRSLANIYRQMLKGAKMADTPFIAVAEDDTLYPAEHFQVRPDMDAFAYNQTHWSLYTWDEPVYHWRDRKGNYSLIAPRELVIQAMEERNAKWPNGIPEKIVGELGRPMVERNMKVTLRNSVEFATTVGVVNFQHNLGMDPYARVHKKRYGPVKAYDIPHWGKAADLVKRFE